jgi:inosine-uridine nucleoside N-ribohydrolase
VKRIALVMAAAAGLSAQKPVIIDTDAGTDDLMAIAFLLSRTDVKVEAITVVDGLAHVPAGAKNVLRLIELAGARVPVYAGRKAPMQRTTEFPAAWRATSDTLPGVKFPPVTHKPEPQNAADYLVARLADAARPVRILALGPLTNLAEAIQRAPNSVRAVAELLIMGGAVRVPGNVETANTTAEWNLYYDPLAAEIVFKSGIPLRMVPLDATNHVLIDAAFVQEFTGSARTPLGRMVAQILEAERPQIAQKIFYAWDPLAAVALVDVSVVSTKPLAIEIRRNAPEEGRTNEATGPPNAAVALDADAARFKKVFLAAFESRAAMPRADRR